MRKISLNFIKCSTEESRKGNDMNSAFMTVLSLSVSGSIMAFLLFAFKPLLKNRVSKAFLYYIWLLVLLRLILPVTSPVNVMDAIPHARQPNTETAGRAYTHTAAEQGAGNSGASINTQVAPAEQTDNGITNSPHAAAAEPPLPVWDFIKNNLLWLWLSGSIISFGWFIISYAYYSRRIKRTCFKSNKDDIELFRQMAGNSRVRLTCSSNVTTPVLIGVIKPVIILPRFAYVHNAMEKELRNILRHELTHYRRKDILYKWFVVAVTSLHWFNPLMVLIRKEIGKACELSCDETVISNMSAIEMRQYGNTLLTFSAAKKYPAGIPATTLSEGKAELKERLVSIMKYRKKSAWLISLIFMMAVMFSGCALGWGLPKKADTNSSGASSQAAQDQPSAPQAPDASEDSSPVSSGTQAYAGSQPKNQNSPASYSTPAQPSVINQVNKALNTKVSVMLPASVPTAKNHHLAATTASKTANYKVNFYETNHAVTINSQAASKGTPIASVEGTLYRDEASAKKVILSNGYSTINISSLNKEMIVDLGHNIKSLCEGAAGHYYITWNEGRWCLHVEGPGDPAYKYAKYPDGIELAKGAVTYLSTNMLPVPHEIGVIRIEDWANNHETTINWQDHKTVYRIASQDPMIALKVAVKMESR